MFPEKEYLCNCSINVITIKDKRQNKIYNEVTVYKQQRNSPPMGLSFSHVHNIWEGDSSEKSGV